MSRPGRRWAVNQIVGEIGGRGRDRTYDQSIKSRGLAVFFHLLSVTMACYMINICSGLGLPIQRCHSCHLLLFFI
jgi:hypothetical protein